jgi:hypothetical protein
MSSRDDLSHTGRALAFVGDHTPVMKADDATALLGNAGVVRDHHYGLAPAIQLA